MRIKTGSYVSIKLNIARGLSSIHHQNLVHRDFHSGNILNDSYNYDGKDNLYSSISDLGLSCLIDYQKDDSKIMGVLPYVAPEVLLGKPYTYASDIYSFGIIMYELLANEYPYPEMDDTELALKICNGYRPNIDNVPLPQLLKDLIGKCWNTYSNKRPSAEELGKIIDSWINYKGVVKDTPFCQQYQAIEQEYNTFSQKPYQIHPNATLTSKMIDTKQITRKLETMDCSKSQQFNFLENTKKQTEIEKYSEELAFDFGKLKLKSKEITSKIKSLVKKDWKNINNEFTKELKKEWKLQGFSYLQTQDWINIGLQPTDYNFATWLRNEIKLTPTELLNDNSRLEDLREQFKEQIQTQIQQPPK